jgi:chloramphenicol 3-O-phosphotransferase
LLGGGYTEPRPAEQVHAGVVYDILVDTTTATTAERARIVITRMNGEE